MRKKLADVKWIKITVNMFDDEKIRIIESMPDADAILVIWIKLLTLAGKNNTNGFIFLSENIPYTDEMLSTIFSRPLNTVRLALQTFKQFGMIDYNEKNFLYLVNWNKHQNVEGLEKIREQNKARASNYRKRLQLIGGYNYLNYYDEVFQRDNGMCVYCGSNEDLCLDHLIPVIKGGDNEKDNLVLACKGCNSGKSGRMFEDTGYIFINQKTSSQYEKVKARLKITHPVTQHHATEKNKKKKENKNKEIYIEIFETYTNNPELLQTLNDFLKMRKVIKKEMTERAIKSLLKKLDKFASTDEGKIAILEQSIISNWADIYELKESKSKKSSVLFPHERDLM